MLGFRWKPIGWQRLVVVVFLLGTAGLNCGATDDAGPDAVPEFAGHLRTESLGSIFSLRWRDEHGATLQGWKRIGDRVATFELLSFDEKTHVLTLKRTDGSLHPLALRDSRVQEELSDTEFEYLRQFLRPGSKLETIPVLTQEKARAFWLRLNQLMAIPESTGVEFDLTGRTLPVEEEARFRKAVEKEQESGRVLVAWFVSGSSEINYYSSPKNPWSLPESMTRNLRPTDWDELALLTATARVRFSHSPNDSK